MIRKIGLLNHMGGGNLGDDATQRAVIQNIKRRWPDAEIVLFSMNPADSSARHGLPSHPIRTETWEHREEDPHDRLATRRDVEAAPDGRPRALRFVRAVLRVPYRSFRRLQRELPFLGRSFAIIRPFDLLIVSGGGQLLDAWGGPWKFPFTIFKWILLARLSGTRCYFLNVGAGPLAHPMGRWFVRNALRLAQYASFRDEDSRILVRQIGFRGTTEVTADCVYALDSPEHPVRSDAEQAAPIVGLSPMAFCDPRVYWQKDQLVYQRLVDNIGSFGRWLGDRNYRLALFSTDIWFDLQTVAEVSSILKQSNGYVAAQHVQDEQMKDLDQLLSRIQSADYIVTCRYHGVVFAHLLNKPVIALTHHPKVTSLMKDLGLVKYCLDIRKCDLGMMEDAFLSMVAERDEIQSRMAEKALSYKKALVTQFDLLFPQRASL